MGDHPARPYGNNQNRPQGQQGQQGLPPGYHAPQGHYGMQYAYYPGPGQQQMMNNMGPSFSGYPPQTNLSNAIAGMSLNPNASAFNPNAPVFQPHFQYDQQLRQAQAYNDGEGYDDGYQQQDPNYQYSDQAAAATAYDYNSAPQIPLSANLYTAMMYSENAALLQEVQVGLEQLIAEPDEFEAWSSAIKDRLVEKSITEEGLKTATALLIEMTLATPSVQYSYARLCAYLCQSVPDFLTKYLLPKLRETHESRISLDDTVLQYLATFFAELFTHVENSNGCKVGILATALFEQMHGLMLDPVKEQFVKCVIQLLKCSGNALEEMDDGKDKMDQLFDRLLFIREGNDISETIKRQIDSVKSLRAAQWGMKSNGQSSTTNLPSGPLYLGPDGEPLSTEERAFLEENFGRLDSSTSDMDDPDMLADYEDFLASQKH